MCSLAGFFHSLRVLRETKSEVRWKIQADRQTWPEQRQTAPGLCLKWASEKTECLWVMVGSRITVTLTHTGLFSHAFAWQSVYWLISTSNPQQQWRLWGQLQKKTAQCRLVEKALERRCLSFLYAFKQPTERDWKNIFLCVCVSAACGVKVREWLLSGISTCGCQPYQIQLTQGELNTLPLSQSACTHTQIHTSAHTCGSNNAINLLCRSLMVGIQICIWRELIYVWFTFIDHFHSICWVFCS